jgi:hypothetical protein
MESTISILKYGPSFLNPYSRYLLLLVSLVFVQDGAAQQSSTSTAQLTIEGVSNSSATRGKNYAVTFYADEACARRGKTHKVFEKKYADSIHTFNALAVDVDQPFIFQVDYLEKRRGQTRRCSSIANVDLKESGNYKAVFSIMDEVTSCNIKIYDMNPAVLNNSDQQAQKNSLLASSAINSPVEIEYKKPAASCAKVGKIGYKNGTPVYTYKDRLG